MSNYDEGYRAGMQRMREVGQARIEELEAKLALRTGEADAKDLIIKGLEAKLARAVEALRPFSPYVDKSSCVITMIWKDGCYQSTYTNTLKPRDFFNARATLAELKGSK